MAQIEYEVDKSTGEVIDETPVYVPAGTPSLNFGVKVRVLAMRDNLAAFADVVINNGFMVKDIALKSGINGMFIDMPARQGADGEWRDIAYPISSQVREQLKHAVIDAYYAEIERMKEIISVISYDD